MAPDDTLTVIRGDLVILTHDLGDGGKVQIRAAVPASVVVPC